MARKVASTVADKWLHENEVRLSVFGINLYTFPVDNSVAKPCHRIKKSFHSLEVCRTAVSVSQSDPAFDTKP